MDREIKFRAWDGKRMDYHPVGDEYNGPTPINTLFEPQTVSLMGYELMQYTGLKDKNGKEIYEADVMAIWDEDLYEIVYDAPSFWFKDKDGLSEPIERAPIYKVVGNIYENPELLDQQP